MGQFRAHHDAPRIWALPDAVRNRYDLSSLGIVFHMAAPMPPWLKEKWIEWLGPERIYELYGGTEAQGATIISGVEWLEHRGSVGKIGETARLRIIGEDGNEVPTGETGEIYFLPNDGRRLDLSLSRRRAEAPRPTVRDHRYGDIGRLDGRRLLFSVGDRLADMICAAARTCIQRMSRVERAEVTCVVIASPNSGFGQRVHAILDSTAATNTRACDGVAAFPGRTAQPLPAPGQLRGRRRRPARRLRKFGVPCCATNAPTR